MPLEQEKAPPSAAGLRLAGWGEGNRPWEVNDGNVAREHG